MTPITMFPAGWALRHFSIEEFVELVAHERPRLIELSKDFIDGPISLKRLGRELAELREGFPADLSVAGTTNLVTCSGLPWERYREYLAVQIAQTRFLGGTMFRLLLGHPTPEVPTAVVIDRINAMCADLGNIRACVEIHGGLESDPVLLPTLLTETTVDIVVDLENMHRAGLRTEVLQSVLPPDRVAYIHVRNLSTVWVEHGESIPDESLWRAYCPEATFLWEPKQVDEPADVRACLARMADEWLSA